jgi:hypothetical protein
MMRPMSSDDDCVRMECLGCGAHTRIERGDYLTSLEERRSIWCSTCANFHTVVRLRERIVEGPVEAKSAVPL